MPDFGPGVVKQIATRDGLDRILGEMQNGTAVAILALHPTVTQLEEAPGLARRRRRRSPRQRTSPA
jgi:hypothetical protein